MHRISETAAIAIVVAVLFLGLQYTASITPQRNPENPLRATIPEAPATDIPGEDMIPPVTTVTSSGVAGLNGWYTSPVEISLLASDNDSGVSEMAYSFDNYTWSDYYGPFYVSSEASTIIYYYSRDFAGNKEPVQSVTANIDMTSPVTAVSLNGNMGLSGWYFSCVTVTLSAEDALSGIAFTEYSIDGAAWVGYNGPFVISQDGQHELTFRSSDIAGNIENIQTVSVWVDTNAPITVASLSGVLGSAGWYSSDVTLTLTASDSISGVADTEFSYDGITWSSYSGPITISGTGVHTVLFCSTDSAGNTEVNRVALVKIDMIPPVTTASVQGNLVPAGWYVSDVTVTLSAMDETSGVAYSEYSIDGGAWTVYAGPLTIIEDGNHTIKFMSIDLAGNVEDAHSVTFGIDRSPPTTVATLAGELGLNGWYTSAVTMTLAPTDSYSGVADTEYSFDQITWSSYDYPITFYNDGVFTIYFYSADYAGSTENMQSITISIDKTRPVTTVELSGTAGQNNWYLSNVAVTLITIDSGSGVAQVKYTFDGITWTDYTGPFVVSEEGISNIAFYSYDNAGNRGYSNSITLCIDKSSPVTTASTQGKLGVNGWYISEVTVTLAATDTTSGTAYTEYSLDAANWFTYLEPFGIRTEGTTILYYRSVDYAGNMETPLLMSIPIDMSTPKTLAVLQGELGNLGWYVSDVNVTLVGTDLASGISITYYSFDNSTWNTYATEFNMTSEGVFVLYFFSVDSAGNTENVKAIDVNIDMTPPTTEINTESYYSTSMISLTATDSISGVAFTYYRIGADWIEYSEPFHFVAAAGLNVIDYYSVDNAGNQELPKSTTFMLTEVEVTSFVSFHPYPPCKYAPLDSLDVYFIYNRRAGYVLMTGSWLLWYNIDVKNELSESIPSLSIAPSLPSDFAMRGLTVWLVLPSGQQVLMYVYMNSTCGGRIVLYPRSYDSVSMSFDGHAVTVTNVPSGARVFVSVAMEFDLTGSVWKSPGNFKVESYTFSTVVQASGIYYSWYTLPVVSHVAKQYPRC